MVHDHTKIHASVTRGEMKKSCTIIRDSGTLTLELNMLFFATVPLRLVYVNDLFYDCFTYIVCTCIVCHLSRSVKLLNKCSNVNVGSYMLMSLWLWCYNHDDFWIMLLCSLVSINCIWCWGNFVNVILLKVCLN